MSVQDFPNLLFALLLPWVTGIVWVRLGWRRGVAGRPFAVIGYGFFVGWGLLVLVMLGLEALGLNQGVIRTTVPLLLLTVLGLLLTRWVDLAPISQTQGPHGWRSLAMTEKWAVAVLLALLALRFGTLLTEVLIRPLYPWDAWMNWAPKARVWFEHQWLVPFVSRNDWMAGGSDAGFYTMGNWDHPPAVPLIQLWVAMVAGRWDDALINLPWWFLGVAMVMAVYGQARAAGFSPVTGLVGAYLLVSLPLVSTHIALAGYADLWIGGWMLLGTFSLYLWAVQGNLRQAPFVLVAAIALPLFKTPGLIWGMILIAVLLVARLRLRTLVWLAVGALVALGVIVLTIGVDIELPRVGRIVLGRDTIVLPYMRGSGVTMHPVWGAVAGHMQVLGTWHLLWSLAAIVVLAGAWLSLVDRGVRVVWLVLVLGMAFLFIVFFMTDKYSDAVDGQTLNRALLHVAPVVVILGLILQEKLGGLLRSPLHRARTVRTEKS